MKKTLSLLAQFPPMASATEYALFNAVVLDFVP